MDGPEPIRPKASRAAVDMSMLEPNIIAVRRPFTALPKFMSNMPSGSGDGSAATHPSSAMPSARLPSSSSPAGMPAKARIMSVGSTPRSRSPRSIPRMLSSMRSSVDIKLEMATTVEQDSGTMATASMGEVSQQPLNNMKFNMLSS